jgi:hypothetical protein
MAPKQKGRGAGAASSNAPVEPPVTRGKRSNAQRTPQKEKEPQAVKQRPNGGIRAPPVPQLVQEDDQEDPKPPTEGQPDNFAVEDEVEDEQANDDVEEEEKEEEDEFEDTNREIRQTLKLPVVTSKKVGVGRQLAWTDEAAAPTGGWWQLVQHGQCPCSMHANTFQTFAPPFTLRWTLRGWS